MEEVEMLNEVSFENCDSRSYIYYSLSIPVLFKIFIFCHGQNIGGMYPFQTVFIHFFSGYIMSDLVN